MKIYVLEMQQYIDISLYHDILDRNITPIDIKVGLNKVIKMFLDLLPTQFLQASLHIIQTIATVQDASSVQLEYFDH